MFTHERNICTFGANRWTLSPLASALWHFFSSCQKYGDSFLCRKIAWARSHIKECRQIYLNPLCILRKESEGSVFWLVNLEEKWEMWACAHSRACLFWSLTFAVAPTKHLWPPTVLLLPEWEVDCARLILFQSKHRTRVCTRPFWFEKLKMCFSLVGIISCNLWEEIMFWKNLNDNVGAGKVSICYLFWLCHLFFPQTFTEGWYMQTQYLALFVKFSKMDIGWNPF